MRNSALYTSLIGKIFGRLNVLSFSRYKRGKPFMKCECSCGNIREVDIYSLKNGAVVSCGCRKRELLITHNLTGTAEYHIWEGIKGRCHNPKSKDYSRYGGRGIFVCDKWFNSFESFLADMGKKPKGYSIERMDNNKGYSPDNCKWIPLKHQARNTSRTVFIELYGKIKSAAEWSIITKIPIYTLLARVKKGWDSFKTLTVKTDGRIKDKNNSIRHSFGYIT